MSEQFMYIPAHEMNLGCDQAFTFNQAEHPEKIVANVRGFKNLILPGMTRLSLQLFILVEQDNCPPFSLPYDKGVEAEEVTKIIQTLIRIFVNELGTCPTITELTLFVHDPYYYLSAQGGASTTRGLEKILSKFPALEKLTLANECLREVQYLPRPDLLQKLVYHTQPNHGSKANQLKFINEGGLIKLVNLVDFSLMIDETNTLDSEHELQSPINPLVSTMPKLSLLLVRYNAKSYTRWVSLFASQLLVNSGQHITNLWLNFETDENNVKLDLPSSFPMVTHLILKTERIDIVNRVMSRCPKVEHLIYLNRSSVNSDAKITLDASRLANVTALEYQVPNESRHKFGQLEQLIGYTDNTIQSLTIRSANGSAESLEELKLSLLGVRHRLQRSLRESYVTIGWGAEQKDYSQLIMAVIKGQHYMQDQRLANGRPTNSKSDGCCICS